MINLFRRAQPSNLIFLLIIILLLRVAILLNPLIYDDLIIYKPFAKILTFFTFDFLSNPVANILFTGFIVFIQSIIFGRIITRYNFFNKTSYIPELMFAVLSSLFTPFLTFSPIIICNFLLLWILDRIFSLYRTSSTLSSVFDMSLIISIGSLIYFPFLFIFPIIWISLLIFRPFSWREWTASLIGLTIPYIFLGTWYFWNDDFSDFYNIWLPFKFTVPQALAIDQEAYLALIPLAIILLLSLNSVRVMFFKNVIQVRKSLQSLGILVVIIGASFLLLPNMRINHLMLAIAPLAVFLTFYFNNARVRWFYESLFMLLILSIFYFQLF